jgi:Flp pilus assembly protein CpaB
LILIGAIVIGGLAAFLTLNYVRGVENENAENNQLVEVLVATGPIPKGASADEAITTKMIAVDERRRADLPAGAVRRNAEIAGQVAAVELTGGEIITTAMFVADSDLSGSKGTSLDKGNVAITISVDEAAGVAGLVQPGDSINILAEATPGDPAGEAADAVEAASGLSVVDDLFSMEAPAVYVFQDVKVLAVGQTLGEPVANAAPAEGEAAPPPPAGGGSGLITVQLPPDQAALLAGVRNSNLYLTLNRPDYEPVPVPFAPIVELPGVQGVSPYPESSDGGQ